MADNEAGSVYLGLKLQDEEFLRQIGQISKRASEHLQKQMVAGLTIPKGAFDFSDLNKEIKAMSGELTKAIKDQTGAIDGMADFLKERLANSFKDAARDGGRSVAKAVDSVKLPKIKAEYDKESLEAMADNLGQQVDLAYAKAQAAKNEMKAAQKALADAQSNFINSARVMNPTGSAKELLEGFNATPFQKAVEESTEKYLKLDMAAQQLGLKLQAATKEQQKLNQAVEKSTQIKPEKNMVSELLNKQKNVLDSASKQMRKTLQDATSNLLKAKRSLDVSAKPSNVPATSAAPYRPNNIGRAADRGVKKLARVGLAMFGIRTALGGIRKLTLSVGDSFTRMIVNNSALASSLNSLTVASDRMKGAFAAMVAPLVQAVAPALKKIVDLATEAFNAIARLIGGLLGMKQVQIATGSTKKFAQNLSGAAGAAGNARKETEKMKRSLAGFDELEILDSKQDPLAGAMGAAGGGMDPGVVFENVSTLGGNLKDAMSNLWSTISDTKAWKQLQNSGLEAFGKIRTSAEGAYTKVREAWDENSPKLISSVKSTGQRMGLAVSGFASNIWIPLKAGEKAAMLDIAGSMGAGLIRAGTGLAGTVDSAFAPFLDSVNKFWDKHGLEIKDKIYTTWDTIGKGVGGVIEGISTAIKKTFDGVTKWFEKHGPEIEKIFMDTWETIWGFVGPIWDEMNVVGQAIFTELKKFFIEMAPKIKNVVVSAMDLMWQKTKAIWNTLLVIAKVIFGALQVFWETWGDDIKKIFSLTWDRIKGIFSFAFDALSLTFDVFSKAFQGDWSGVWENVKKIGERIWEGLCNIFSRKIEFIKTIFGMFGVNVDEVVKDVKRTFAGLIKFISGVFSGDWRRAWQGVTDIFSGVFGGLSSIVKKSINAIISAVNSMISKINCISFRIPITGQVVGFNIPHIPYLARGGIVDQPTLAMVGEAGREAVMPLDRNTGWIDQLASKLTEAGGGGGEIHVTIPVSIGEGNLMDVIEMHFDRQGRVRNAPVFN